MRVNNGIVGFNLVRFQGRYVAVQFYQIGLIAPFHPLATVRGLGAIIVMKRSCNDVDSTRVYHPNT